MKAVIQAGGKGTRLHVPSVSGSLLFVRSMTPLPGFGLSASWPTRNRDAARAAGSRDCFR